MERVRKSAGRATHRNSSASCRRRRPAWPPVAAIIFIIALGYFIWRGDVLSTLRFRNSDTLPLDRIVLTYRTRLAVSDQVNRNGVYDGRARDLDNKMRDYVISSTKSNSPSKVIEQFAEFVRQEGCPELPPDTERRLREISETQIKVQSVLQNGGNAELARLQEMASWVSLRAWSKANVGEYDLAALEKEVALLEAVLKQQRTGRYDSANAQDVEWAEHCVKRSASQDVMVLSQRALLALSNGVIKFGRDSEQFAQLKAATESLADQCLADPIGYVDTFADLARIAEFPKLPTILERRLRVMSDSLYDFATAISQYKNPDQFDQLQNDLMVIMTAGPPKVLRGEYDIATIEIMTDTLEKYKQKMDSAVRVMSTE